MNLLHLDSSILGENSTSRAISAQIVDTLIQANSELELTYRDLTAEAIPHLTLDALGTAADAPDIAQFLDADVVVIGAGMYNFTIPTQLKAWFDRVLIAGKTFRYTAQGPEGLAGNKQVFVALARGGFYGEGQPTAHIEHAESYLRAVLAFVGITNPTFIFADGLSIDAETRQASLAAAIEQAKQVSLT